MLRTILDKGEITSAKQLSRWTTTEWKKVEDLQDHFFVASMNMARVQCSTSSDCDGGGGKVGCSTISHPSMRHSFFPLSDNSVA